VRKPTIGSAPNIVSTCSWRPSNRGAVSLTATATAIDIGIPNATANPMIIQVLNRTGPR
jgi:hypothetical protein